MPIRSTFRPTNVSQPNKKVLEITKYKGVDYSTTKLNVADDHAIEIKNIIHKDNVNQKRNGWEQIAKANAIEYCIENTEGTIVSKTNSTNFNGLWIIKINNVEYVIAHIGSLLFTIDKIGRNQSFLNAKLTPLTTQLVRDGKLYKNFVNQELNDSKSNAFYGDERLYILDGRNYLVLKFKNYRFELTTVEDDEETYIPTTTVGITYKGSPVNLAAPLDDVNMLTQYRKNKLVSGTYIEDDTTVVTEFCDYELDTNVNPKNPTDINNIKITINSLREGE